MLFVVVFFYKHTAIISDLLASTYAERSALCVFYVRGVCFAITNHCHCLHDVAPSRPRVYLYIAPFFINPLFLQYWDAVSTLANEVHDPARTFPRALLLAMVVVVIMYLSVLGVAIGNTPCCSSDWSTCSARYWGAYYTPVQNPNTHDRSLCVDAHNGRLQYLPYIYYMCASFFLCSCFERTMALLLYTCKCQCSKSVAV